MDSSLRSGFRRAAAASWALTGIGIAGIAGASVVCYVDTLKPVSASTSTDAVHLATDDATEEGTEGAGPNPVPNIGLAPEDEEVDSPERWLTTAPPAQPEYVAPTTVGQAPAPTRTPEYTPQTTVERAPITHQTSSPKAAAPTTRRHRLTPSTVLAPSYSPPIVRSRGS